MTVDFGRKMGVEGVKTFENLQKLTKVGAQRMKKCAQKFDRVGAKCEQLRKICFERFSWASAALQAAEKGPQSTIVHLRPAPCPSLASATRFRAQNGM